MKNEDRYTELQDKFEALAEDEKDFLYWYTTVQLIEQWKAEKDKAEKEVTKETYYKDIRYIESLKREIEALSTIQFTLSSRIF